MYVDAPWDADGSGGYYIFVTGSYEAATDGFNNTNRSADTVHNDVLFSYGWGRSNAYLPYTYGSAGAFINARSSVGADVPFDTHAE